MSNTQKYKFPWFTSLLTLTSIALYIAMAWFSGSVKIEPYLFEKFGAPYAIQIYQGQYWGVIVNSLIHAFPEHLVLNIIGLWVFGAFLERRIGWLRLFVFGLITSTVTSIVQLTLSNDAGLGLSGVNYALFGLTLMLSFKNSYYRIKGIYIFATIMFGLLIFCWYKNINDHWFVGMEALYTGLFWGLLVGLVSRWNKPLIKFSVLSIPFLILASTLFYAPWSTMWQTYMGIEEHNIGGFEKAKKYYAKAIALDPSNKIALENIKLIQVEKLSQKAYDAHQREDYINAYKYYLEILAIDPTNSWARTNIKELP